jgi:enoyl-CoA hydratase/carnithine racemase
LVLGGQNIGGEEALRIGLVDHLAPAEDFPAHLDEIAHHYLQACSTGTRMSKLVLNQAFDMDFEMVYRYYLELQERAQYSLDGEEGKRAYREKREPKWQ